MSPDYKTVDRSMSTIRYPQKKILNQNHGQVKAFNTKVKIKSSNVRYQQKGIVLLEEISVPVM
jgi:hypothetical protein